MVQETEKKLKEKVNKNVTEKKINLKVLLQVNHSVKRNEKVNVASGFIRHLKKYRKKF